MSNQLGGSMGRAPHAGLGHGRSGRSRATCVAIRRSRAASISRSDACISACSCSSRACCQSCPANTRPPAMASGLRLRARDGSAMATAARPQSGGALHKLCQITKKPKRRWRKRKEEGDGDGGATMRRRAAVEARRAEAGGCANHVIHASIDLVIRAGQ